MHEPGDRFSVRLTPQFENVQTQQRRHGLGLRRPFGCLIRVFARHVHHTSRAMSIQGVEASTIYDGAGVSKALRIAHTM